MQIEHFDWLFRVYKNAKIRTFLAHIQEHPCPQSEKSEVPKKELFIEFERAPDWIEGFYVFRMIFLQKLN